MLVNSEVLTKLIIGNRRTPGSRDVPLYPRGFLSVLILLAESGRGIARGKSATALIDGQADRQDHGN